MTDRELLEKAAKAVGIECIGPMGNDGLHLFNGKHWNPLTDDGDALRLAVKLRLNIMQGHFSVGANDEDEIDEAALVRGEEERSAVVRRVIVRAAAAMAEKAGE